MGGRDRERDIHQEREREGVKMTGQPRVRCCVSIYFLSVSKAKCFELQIVIRKIYNSESVKEPR